MAIGKNVEKAQMRAEAAAERLGAEILEKCIEEGGTITGEHGVGREKINQMAVE